MDGGCFDGVTLFRGSVGYRRGLWRWAWVAPLICCVACVRPLPPVGRDEVIHRELSELIVSGTVLNVRDSRWSTLLIDASVWRQDVCMTVDHVLKGAAGKDVCFVQFTGDYSHSGKRPLPAVEPGERILMFLNQRDVMWRPPTDFVRMWVELPCGEKCRLPLTDSTLEGKMAELILRFDSGLDARTVADVVPVSVRNAIRVAGRQVRGRDDC